MHDHAHPHGSHGTGHRRLLAISLGITATVMLVQIVGAVLSGSLALLADAAHMFADASALVIALIASAVAARPADARRTFGYQRAEVFGALINGILLTVLAVMIAVEGVQRLLDPAEAEIAAPLMLVVAIVGLIANGIAMWLLSGAQRTNINVRGAYLEVMGDLLGSLAVIVAAVVILLTGWSRADAVVSLLIAAMILPRAFGLLREVVSVFAESAPKGTDIEEIRHHLAEMDGVVAVHDVHVWQITRGAPVFSAHVAVDPRILANDAAGMLTRMQECLAGHFDVAHSTFQLEPADYEDCAPTHR